MAVADNSNVNRRDWKKKESLPSALIQIGIVGLLLAGAVFFIYQRGAKRKEVAERLKEARELAIRGNPKDLEKALAELDELFKVDASAPDALALAAGLYTEQWLLHKVPGAEAKARDYLKQAEAADSKSEERYGAHALQLIADGKAQQADTYIDELRKQGANSARLWQAVGLAQQSLGNLQLSKQAFNSAMEKGWKDPRFSTSYGEALLAEGQYLQALDVLSKATNGNPDHFRARLMTSLVRVYKADRVKDATDTVEEILSREPELTPGLKALALAVKAELASFSTRHDEAIQLADQALAVDADQKWALYAKARALGLKKAPEAADAFKAAVAKAKTTPLMYFEGATLLQGAGSHDAAMALLSDYENMFKGVQSVTSDGQAVSALERDDRYWLTRGDVLRAAEKLDEAMTAYEKAIAASNVNLVKAHYAKASLLIAKKEYDQATEVLTSITPPDGSGSLAEAYVAMGEALMAKKDYGPACQNYAFALAKFKAQQVPRERLNELLVDVEKKLISANQRPIAKVWVDEAKPLIQ